MKVRSIDMGRLQALRLHIVGGETDDGNPHRLFVGGDLTIPALRIEADQLYLGTFTVRDDTRFGVRDRVTTPSDYAAGQNLRDDSVYRANRSIVGSLRVGAALPRGITPRGYELVVGTACGGANLVSGDDNACARAGSLNSN